MAKVNFGLYANIKKSKQIEKLEYETVTEQTILDPLHPTTHKRCNTTELIDKVNELIDKVNYLLERDKQ